MARAKSKTVPVLKRYPVNTPERLRQAKDFARQFNVPKEAAILLWEVYGSWVLAADHLTELLAELQKSKAKI